MITNLVSIACMSVITFYNVIHNLLYNILFDK